MEKILYEASTNEVDTQIIAILQCSRLTISGYDYYHPSSALPEGSEYEYETLLDSYSTQQIIELLGVDKTEEELLDCLYEMFHGERADIRFQSYCLNHGIETYSSSHFDD